MYAGKGIQKFYKNKKEKNTGSYTQTEQIDKQCLDILGV